MDFELLSKNIKRSCKDRGINVNQLEKELGFGAGSISRWGQSSPSIEKVKAVADYFNMSVDEICGFCQIKDETRFMECLVDKTIGGEIVWIPCSDTDMLRLNLKGTQLECSFKELYCAFFNHGTIYVGCNEQQPELFVSLEENVCMKQDEDLEQLRRLWDLLKDKELQLKERIDRYKMDFVHL